MPLRDILHKKDKLAESSYPSHPDVPQIKFIRSDTTSHEIISPPSYDDHSRPPSSSSATTTNTTRSPRRSLNPFSRSRSGSESNTSTPAGATTPPRAPRGERRLSHLLRGSGSRNSSGVSVNVPENLPQIAGAEDAQEREAQWEKRATVLVQRNPNLGGAVGGSSSSHHGSGRGVNGNASGLSASSQGSGGSRSRSSSVGGPEKDLDIQEAIRLHEVGELEKSTDMFRRLADPNGVNNALSQVLYGLALRHGWGCTQDFEQAVTYLSAAAENSALVESQALQAGMKKGGAAKGELVLAIFELGNCFRNGWGVKKDPVAARQYFETAANLGDTDAMIETAWCYLEGFGGKKDKFTAAKYYRLAEEKGNKIVGNSWIWKDKYAPK